MDRRSVHAPRGCLFWHGGHVEGVDSRFDVWHADDVEITSYGWW